MRDFLPADVRRREYVIGVIKEVYERYGFEPLETPAVENIETLLGKYGEEGNQLIYKILKRGVHEATGEADLALRYDLTVPLARVVAEYRDKLPKFFKRYQIQPVWRADRPARGRFREFYQCDVDVLGSRSMVVEAEICAAASDVLTKLGFNDFTIRLNHRRLLTALLVSAGVPDEYHEKTLIALDKLDKIGQQGVEGELREHIRAIRAMEAAITLLYFFSDLTSLESAAEVMAGEDLYDKQQALNEATIGRLIEFVGGNENGAKAIEELRFLLTLARAAGIDHRMKIDPRLARGLSYYTGTIMEISVKDLPGSLGGGGRYDELVGMFSKQDVPACGFSLGLERIIQVMTEKEMFPKTIATSSADVLIGALDEESIPDALKLARELRQIGRVDVYPDCEPKIKPLFAYAEARGIRLLIIIGSNERESNQVTLRDLSLREQQTLPIQLIVREVREKLSAG